MSKKELEEYINRNSHVIEIFSEKALEYQTDKNNNRFENKRWDEVKIAHTVDRMVNAFIEDVYQKLRSQIKENRFAPKWSWIDFMIKNEVLDKMEESVIEIKFE
ncbi:hypothetical protein [Ligilactobacillus acidipiscis]|uniref:hypothetical protein n=1 Tax=Ligilactobacillus acidipiscis TaxID=89059 RepID=UPI0023FA35B3|nr:hypothetical protein [Ligilactobacillus acidipiscis]WEV56173.1 hypothetical protein OZX66_07910 [Ligilactobacillus acidipiscis]